MVAYNFQSQFADDVAEGRKRQTIRAYGKRKHAAPMNATTAAKLRPSPWIWPACKNAAVQSLHRQRNTGRPVIAVLPNSNNPDAPLNIAKVCCESLNKVWEAHQEKKGAM